MTNQNDLQAVIDRAKADIAKNYVFVHMPIPQLETLLKGLEEAEKDRIHAIKLMLAEQSKRSEYEQCNVDLEARIEALQRELEEKDDAISYAMNQIQIKESHIRKMEGSHAAS